MRETHQSSSSQVLLSQAISPEQKVHSLHLLWTWYLQVAAAAAVRPMAVFHGEQSLRTDVHNVDWHGDSSDPRDLSGYYYYLGMRQLAG